MNEDKRETRAEVHLKAGRPLEPTYALSGEEMTKAAGDRVLKRYPRAIAHMFNQLKNGKFGLILGAGVNGALGFPDWPTLVDRISKHPSVGAIIEKSDAVKTPLPILAQVLLQHFKRNFLSDNRFSDISDVDRGRLASSAFRKIIHECLYEGVPPDDEELLRRDRFYRYYLSVIRQSSMTVTYNFDDTLERLLMFERNQAERSTSRGFETVTDVRLQFRLSRGIIYHPNGFLPTNPLEGGANSLVFSEDSFADQLIDTMTGHYSSLLNHLSKNTCLLVGLSLADSTLRHLLRQNAKINPGHYHYVVHHVGSGGDGDGERESREDANFEVFNLITLFLSTEEIAALGDLIGGDWSDLRGRAEEVGVKVSYCFYITGVPGVGKTTTTSYFNNLVTYDEWLDRRLPEMGKPFDELTDEERLVVDQWILEQLGYKNKRLHDYSVEKGVGISLVDRCVPDAIAFTPARGWAKKARSLISAISPGQSKRTVHPGHVILLTGDPQELVLRAECGGKRSNLEYVTKLQEDTLKVYKRRGITRLKVETMSVSDVVRSVARLIHLGKYEECSIQGILTEFARSHWRAGSEDVGSRQSPMPRRPLRR